MFKIITTAKYKDLINTIDFQESQINHLAKALKEAKRQPRDSKGHFMSAKCFSETHGSDC